MKNIVLVFSFCFFAISIPIEAQGLFSKMTNNKNSSRTYDVLHYRIEVSFYEAKKTIFGNTTITFLPIITKLDTIEFDAEDMKIKKVTFIKGHKARFVVKPKKLWIRLDRTYSQRDTISLKIEYSATPKKGLYFVQPDSGFPSKPRQIWTQGEAEDNHHWFPCHDFPDDKATSEVIVIVDEKYSALSNGALLDVRYNPKSKTKTFHWKMSKPHSSYLTMLAIGEYEILRENFYDIPLEYWVYKHHIDDARICFKETPQIMKFFNERIGFNYPWEKYAQVLIADFMWGGMENVTATSLKDEIAVYDARARIDNNPRGLIAHEMSHMWWGDLVTCKNWSHLWLNEGFASYFDLLYQQTVTGQDEFLYNISNSQSAGISSDNYQGRKPIVSEESYPANLYPRSASVLHMLRYVLGDSLFWRSLNHYITKFAFQAVETKDFQTSVEEIAGEKLDWFFDQWIYKAGYPKFKVNYEYVDSSKQLSVSVSQTQKMDSLTRVFNTPVDIEITTQKSVLTKRFAISTKETTFTFSVDSKPLMVIFDKGGWILKSVEFEKSSAEWKYQAEKATNPVDRIIALNHLAESDERTSFINLFSNSALNDTFWAVRQQALRSLAGIISDSLTPFIKNSLIEATYYKRSAMPSVAVEYLGDYPDKKVTQRLIELIQTDSSYNVAANAITALANIDSALGYEYALKNIEVQSYQNVIINASLRALSELGGKNAIPFAIKYAKYGNFASTRNIALRILARQGKGNENVFRFYIRLLNDPEERIRIEAVHTLADFEDIRAIKPLEMLLKREKSLKVISAVEQSVSRLKVKKELER